jgi:6-pyruvoyl-tetrahydropterin synthase
LDNTKILYHLNKTLFGIIILFILNACSSVPKMKSENIRSWSNALGNEYPNEKAMIAHYKKGQYELFYLAARHTNTMGDDTLNLVQTLFNEFNFNILMIESIPYSSGESPKWFVEEARQGRNEKFIRGGESALGVILADEKKIPFIAGEPDHQDIYKALKSKGYTDEDILGFYTVRQVPQWVREKLDKKTLLKKKIPPFLTHYCKIFSVRSCPTSEEVMKWYKTKLGHELVPEVSNEEVAPYSDGTLYTQKISSDVGYLRDHFTLNLIQEALRKHKRVAVIYGAGHYLTLRKSFDEAFGDPTFIEDKK